MVAIVSSTSETFDTSATCKLIEGQSSSLEFDAARDAVSSNSDCVLDCDVYCVRMNQSI